MLVERRNPDMQVVIDEAALGLDIFVFNDRYLIIEITDHSVEYVIADRKGLIDYLADIIEHMGISDPGSLDPKIFEEVVKRLMRKYRVKPVKVYCTKKRGGLEQCFETKKEAVNYAGRKAMITEKIDLTLTLDKIIEKIEEEELEAMR